jgi:MerR family mercuric resistance operon transcriptional regulator
MATGTDGRTISDLARDADVNVETIRYYERIGLLRQPPKPARGWRRYEDSALHRILFVKRAQHLGFTLAEIQELLGLRTSNSPRTCARVAKKTSVKLELIDEKIRDLKAMRSVLADLVSSCPGDADGERCPILRSLASSDLSRPTARS